MAQQPRALALVEDQSLVPTKLTALCNYSSREAPGLCGHAQACLHAYKIKNKIDL